MVLSWFTWYYFPYVKHMVCCIFFLHWRNKKRQMLLDYLIWHEKSVWFNVFHVIKKYPCAKHMENHKSQHNILLFNTTLLHGIISICETKFSTWGTRWCTCYYTIWYLRVKRMLFSHVKPICGFLLVLCVTNVSTKSNFHNVTLHGSHRFYMTLHN